VPIDDPLPDIPMGDVHVRLVPVADGLTAPNYGAIAPGHPGRLFVTDQNGILWNVDVMAGTKSVALDVSGLLVTLGVFGPGSFDERGFLGVAFHPEYQVNGLVYTYTSEPVGGNTPDFTTVGAGLENHHAVIREWSVPTPSDPDAVVDPGSSRVLMRVAEPQFNHNAGALNFGPDGLLYIAFGDGGGADDQDGQGFIGGPIIGHGCTGNGSNLGTILGSILRIDPQGSSSTNGEYGIPGDNPFVGVGGALGEIYAYGFRNPFRFSFDQATGDLWVGDVGQNDVEEIDVVTAGGFYGWHEREGSFDFVTNGASAGYVTHLPATAGPGSIDPVAQYDHDDGIAILGGFVYHGAKIPALA